MKPEEEKAIVEIKGKYRCSTSSEKKGVGLHFDHVLETFTLVWLNGEFILFTEMWHEHFADVQELMTFLDGLFSGAIQVVVKCRGKSPVGHQVQRIVNGKKQVVSQVGSLVPLFWRKKTLKTMEYRTANQGVHGSLASSAP